MVEDRSVAAGRQRVIDVGAEQMICDYLTYFADEVLAVIKETGACASHRFRCSSSRIVVCVRRALCPSDTGQSVFVVPAERIANTGCRVPIRIIRIAVDAVRSEALPVIRVGAELLIGVALRRAIYSVREPVADPIVRPGVD